MYRTYMLSKLHQAAVTQTDLNYMGSITIDSNLLEATGMRPHEKVDIYNIDNGNRFSTYILPGEAGSGVIGINGAAARLARVGDRVIIVNFGQLSDEEAKNHKPVVRVLDANNNIVETYR